MSRIPTVRNDENPDYNRGNRYERGDVWVTADGEKFFIVLDLHDDRGFIYDLRNAKDGSHTDWFTSKSIHDGARLVLRRGVPGAVLKQSENAPVWNSTGGDA